MGESDMPVRAYVGLGSNLDDPLAQVTRALGELDAIIDTRLLKASGLYRNAPMGPKDQPDYINAAALIETRLAPLALLEALRAIETAHERVRNGQHWGPRTLDLDLLLYGQAHIELPGLRVPHPGLHERAFVLYPLHDIDPELIIPGHGPLARLCERYPHAGLERLDSP